MRGVPANLLKQFALCLLALFALCVLAEIPDAHAARARNQPVAKNTAPEDVEQHETHDDPPFKRLTIDIGGSSTFSSTASAYEFNLGVNYFILRWLVWRNAPFYRIQSGLDSRYGLDSSLQGRQSFELVPGFTPSVLAGGGYRFANSGSSAPFLEAGLGLHMGGLNVGASAKRIFNSVRTAGAPNETIYSIVFAGGASLF